MPLPEVPAPAHDPAAGAQRRGVLIIGDGRLAETVYERFAGKPREWIRLRDPDYPEQQLQAALRKRPARVLALSDRAEDNLRAAIDVAGEDRDVPIVIRAFDPALADEIERAGGDGPLNVQRAYSMSNLAAPAFVAAALLEDGEDSVATVRVGDAYVSVCRLHVRDAGRRARGHALGGLTPAQLFARHRCQVLERRGGRAQTADAGDDDVPFEAGEEVLLGGRLLDVLELARQRSPVGRLPRRRLRVPRHAWQPALRAAPERARSAMSQLSTQVLALLVALVTITAFQAPVRGLAARFHTWVLVALGNDPVQGASPRGAQAVLGAVGLLAGGVALGLAISLMSAFFTDRRMTEAAYRRAGRMRRHVIVVGLSDLGLHVAQLLVELRVPFVVVEPSERAGTETTARTVRQLNGAPVLAGALADSLPLASADAAQAVIACAESDLVNVEACLRAKRAGGESVLTVARIFEDAASADIHVPLGVDHRRAAVELAAPAFVDAAIHDEAVRTFEAAGGEMIALRWPDGQPFGSRQMREWHAHGVRLLATWTSERGARPPDEPCAGLHEEATAVLAGPQAAMRAVVDDLERRTRRPRRLHAVSDPA